MGSEALGSGEGQVFCFAPSPAHYSAGQGLPASCSSGLVLIWRKWWPVLYCCASAAFTTGNSTRHSLFFCHHISFSSTSLCTVNTRYNLQGFFIYISGCVHVSHTMFFAFMHISSEICIIGSIWLYTIRIASSVDCFNRRIGSRSLHINLVQWQIAPTRVAKLSRKKMLRPSRTSVSDKLDGGVKMMPSDHCFICSLFLCAG